MINLTKLDYKLQVRFGQGNINIIPGYNWENGRKVAGVGLREQSPRTIDINNGDSTDDIESITDLPVSLMFANTESIDVLIYALNQAKYYMKTKGGNDNE